MLASADSRKYSGEIEQRTNDRTADSKKESSTAQIRVHSKLFSPSKADKWDTRHASIDSSSNYTLTMARESDLDDRKTRERHLEDQLQDIESGDIQSDYEDDFLDCESCVDCYLHFEWLEMIVGKVTLQRSEFSQETQIADCKGYLIRRHEIADSFWDAMTDLDPQMDELAFELFDRYGCLQPKFKNHPLRRGCSV
jgi:hypothetical protein